MKSLAAQLDGIFKEALTQVIGDEGRTTDPVIRPAGEERFGDYQSNVAMGLAKKLGQKPRDLAQKIVDALQQNPQATQWFEPFEVAGPGFINIRLKSKKLAAILSDIPEDERLGIEPTQHPQTVVVDYSGPNIAKQMHVGHLRSTIIGDSIARILEFEGHRVIRQNHIGDWGLPIAMVITQLMPKYWELYRNLSYVDDASFPLEEVEKAYKEATARFSKDTEFEKTVRSNLAELQSKPSPEESNVVSLYFLLCRITLSACNDIYARLHVKLLMRGWVQDANPELIVENPGGTSVLFGESEYEPFLKEVVSELISRFDPEISASAVGTRIEVFESDGAICVFHYNNSEPIFKNPEGRPLPLIIRKSDGTYLYATTDLAAIQYRINKLSADQIIYVTDARQDLHFQMVFATARSAGWTLSADKNQEVKLDHVTFGSILGGDRKPLKTRSGENIKLAELLEEAVNRSEQLIRANEADPEKKRGFTEEEIRDIAEAVGIGAVKYADLSQNRQSDYVFSWDKMLAMEGNTAPYLMYAYARIRSIYRKGNDFGELTVSNAPVLLTEPVERNLGRQILRFAETIDSIAGNLKLNVLTDYLYDLAGAFMKFYESCPVLTAPTVELRASRLKLADLTARTLRIGLDLLGIRVVERM